MIQTLQLLELCAEKNVWLKGIKDGVDSRTESGRFNYGFSNDELFSFSIIGNDRFLFGY